MAGLIYPITVQDRASAAFDKIAGSAGTAAEAAERLDEVWSSMSKYQQRAAQSAVKAAAAIEDVGKAMADTAGESTGVQRATLGVVAAQDRLATAMESGRASAAALADAQSSLIGAQERLSLAFKTSADASRVNSAAIAESKTEAAGLMSGFGGLIETAGELGLVIGGIEIAKKAIEFIGAGKELTTSLNAIQAASNASAAQMAVVRTQAIGLGKDLTVPGATAVDAADAIQDLVKAGIALPRALQAARPALLLASATQTDMADTSKVLGDTLDIYSLKASQATHVANL